MTDGKTYSLADSDRRLMRRALQLARNGILGVSSNPMVGAVIVTPDGRIIGEGYHRKYGEAHAEVNAVNSTSPEDRDLFRESTIYVTLEPCAHYGKTPPCALLLAECGFRRAVIATADPFGKVNGKGLEILRASGMEVQTGVLEHEARSLNARFFTAHELKRPFITLKWARSADGFMDIERRPEMPGVQFSTPSGKVLVHRLRATHGAIAVGSGTIYADNPRLDLRFWPGNCPKKVVFDRRGRLGEATKDVEERLYDLYSEGITSILVEGGPTLLNSFIQKGLWDLARVETAQSECHNLGRAKAPIISLMPFDSQCIDGNTVYYYSNNPLVNKYFINNGL